MIYDAINMEYELACSGRKFYAYGGVIGLGIDPSKSEILYGWDGDLGEGTGPLSLTEQAEIAHHMMKLWEQFYLDKQQKLLGEIEND